MARAKEIGSRENQDMVEELFKPNKRGNFSHRKNDTLSHATSDKRQ
jgi:hypothetical protein